LRRLASETNKEKSTLIGRSEETSAFRSALKRAANGNGSLVLVSGPGGIGKSALLARFAKMAATFGDVTALQFDRAGVDAAVDRFENAAKLRQQTLLVDDVDRADRQTLELLDALADLARFSRLTIVASFTDGPRELPSPQLAGAVARWRAGGAMWCALEPLSESEMMLILRSWQLASSAIVERSATGEFLRVSHGNPRYAREFLSELRRGCDVAELVPSSAIAEAIALRHSAGAEISDALTLAAVFGERFSDVWLRRMLSCGEEEVTRAIQTGIDRSLLRSALDHQGLYVFRDPAIQKALYVSIAPERRKSLHVSVATMLEKERKDERFDHLIAGHWEAAGEYHRAAKWLAQSAAQSQVKGEHRAAAELYERAARNATRTQQLALVERAAQCYENAGAVEDAVPLRESVVSGLTARQNVDRFAGACMALIDDYLWMGRRVDALGLVQRLQKKKGTAARSAMARSSLCLTLGLCRQGLESEAHRAFGALQYEDLPPADRPRYHLAAAMLQSNGGTVDQALAAIATAADLAEEVGDVRRSTSTLLQCALAACLVGRLDTAMRLVDRADRRSAENDESGRMNAWAQMSRAYYETLAGDLVTARDRLATLADISGFGDMWEANVAALNVLVGMRTGDAVLVDAFFDLALLRRVIDAGSAGVCATLLMSFPEAMAGRGLSRELRQVLAHCAQSGWGDLGFTTELAIARFGPLESARAVRERVRARINGANADVARASADLFDAWIAKRQNNRAATVRAASAAAAGYEKLGWRVFQALALELAGDFAAARELYQECGASYDADSLRRKGGRRITLASRGAPLTLREREIAKLVCLGQSDPTIADHLGISARTVQNHVAAIFGKLGIRARWQLAGALDGALAASR
jgi:DNA-binding NarL/FixJ family response regulator